MAHQQFLFNDMVLELGECSADFRVRYVTVPAERVFEIFVSITSLRFWEIFYVDPCRRFEASCKRQLDYWFEECEFVSSRCSAELAAQVVPSLMLNMFAVMEDLVERAASGGDRISDVAPSGIVGAFFVLLARHYMTEHKVLFYADALNITPDYLTAVIRQCSGFTPKQIIEGKLVLAMKAWLKFTDMPVKK